MKGYPADSVGAKEEIAAADRAIAIEPGLTEAHNLLASIYLQFGKVSGDQ